MQVGRLHYATLGFALALGLSACGSESGDGGDPAAMQQCAPGDVACTGVAGGGGQLPPGMQGMIDPGDPAATSDLPCDVLKTTKDNCWQCHGAQPKFGAPNKLVSTADFHAMSTQYDPTRTVAAVASERVQLVGPGQMPQIPNPALVGEQLTSYVAWLDAGAQAKVATEGLCMDAIDVIQPPPPGGETVMPPQTEADGCNLDPAVACPGQVNQPGKEFLATCGVCKDENGFHSEAEVAAALDCEMFRFQTHGAVGQHSDDDPTPYQVGVAVDKYLNFVFMPKWEGTKYGRAYISILDNLTAVHHYLLYKNLAAKPQGGIEASIGAHADGQLVKGWAPGGEDLVFKAGAGMEMPQTSYSLEMHYNSNDPAAADRTGIAVCMWKEMPPNLIGLSWLGTDALFSNTASGNCIPTKLTDKATIVGVNPHMHEKGIRQFADITRKDGSKESLLDVPFDFDNQIGYGVDDIEIFPGDSILTTCEYSTSVTFGQGTGAEMCYMFTLYYPDGQLRDNGSIIHGANTCLGAGTL